MRKLNASDPEVSHQPLVPAAAYVRMSTEKQCYSADNQLEAINAYAAERGLEVAVVYADLGKSGVRLEGRPGIQQLLHDVEAGATSFKALLVYDVSRWGRFQDPDEAAAYELKCKRAGVAVHYCAEGFENDGSVSSSLLKALKRVMAGEYSRELSAKVKRGQMNLARKGFHVGGPAPYGLRRILFDEAGNRKGLLKEGQRKAIVTDRVMLERGPEPELRAIRRIFRMYLDEQCTRAEIVRVLRRDGVTSGRHPAWTNELVRTILCNEKYTALNVWGRSSLSLDHVRVRLPSETWLRQKLPFAPIISAKRFRLTQEAIAARAQSLSNEQVLAALRRRAKRRGRLSRDIINEAKLGFSADLLKRRFGGQLEAYELIGYQPKDDYSAVPIYREIRSRQHRLRTDLATRIHEVGLVCRDDRRKSVLRLEGGLNLLFLLLRSHQLPSGLSRWKFRKRVHAEADLFVLGRLTPDGSSVQDYYVLAAEDLPNKEYQLDDINSPQLAQFRSADLEPLFWRLSHYPSVMLMQQ